MSLRGRRLWFLQLTDLREFFLYMMDRLLLVRAKSDRIRGDLVIFQLLEPPLQDLLLVHTISPLRHLYRRTSILNYRTKRLSGKKKLNTETPYQYPRCDGHDILLEKKWYDLSFALGMYGGPNHRSGKPRVGGERATTHRHGPVQGMPGKGLRQENESERITKALMFLVHRRPGNRFSWRSNMILFNFFFVL